MWSAATHAAAGAEVGALGRDRVVRDPGVADGHDRRRRTATAARRGGPSGRWSPAASPTARSARTTPGSTRAATAGACTRNASSRAAANPSSSAGRAASAARGPPGTASSRMLVPGPAAVRNGICTISPAPGDTLRLTARGSGAASPSNRPANTSRCGSAYGERAGSTGNSAVDRPAPDGDDGSARVGPPAARRRWRRCRA